MPPDDPSTPADASEQPEDTSEGPGLELTSLDLSEIVRDSVAQASVASPAVVVEVSTPPSLPAVGEADALGGVVRMLVDHACRQTDAGVTVKAKRGDEGITVHVIDRGPGMDRDHAPDGFAQAKTLVALHGGILWAEPLPGGGTKVAFTIPEQPPALEGEDLEEAAEALKLLDHLAAPAAAPGAGEEVEAGATVDLTESDPESAAPIDLATMVELAAAEATIQIEEPDAGPEVPNLPMDAPEEIVEPPVGLEDLWPDPVDEPAEPSEVTGPIETVVPQFVDAEIHPEAEIHQEMAERPVDLPAGEAPTTDEGADLPLPSEAPSMPDATVASAGEPPGSVEERPAAASSPEQAHARGEGDRQAEATDPPKRFVLDPLHPATQLLRGLALDYDPDADDLPGFSLGRGGRTR